MKKISLDRLKELLHYSHETGVFIRAMDKATAKKGDVAGTKGNRGYRLIRLDAVEYLAHRLAWLYYYGSEAEGEIDHINHIRDDNRISNLRVTTRDENQRNKKLASNNKSGVVGVRYNAANNRWRADIRVNGKKIDLGSFIDKEDAVLARSVANVKYGFHKNHGDRT